MTIRVQVARNGYEWGLFIALDRMSLNDVFSFIKSGNDSFILGVN